MKRFARWIIIAIVGLVVLCVAVSALNRGDSTFMHGTPRLEEATQSIALAENADVATAAPTEAVAPTVGEAVATTAPVAQTPPPAAQVVTFGTPVNLSSGGLNMMAVPVTNPGSTVKTFTVKATFKQGENIIGTAVGTVNDLLPGQTRAVTLIWQEQIPATFESTRIDVDTMVQDEPSTPGSEAAGKLAFGPPQVTNSGGLGMVNVEVTNNDTSPHTFTVQVMFQQGEQLVAVATGSVNDLAPGQTKTASLLVQGTPGNAPPTIAVDTMVQ